MGAFPAKAIDPVFDLSSAGLRMTFEEFEAVENYCEIYDYELVDGVLVVRPTLDDANCAVSEEMSYLLRRYRDEHPCGEEMSQTVYGHYIRTSRGYRRAHRVIWTGLLRRPHRRKDVPSIVIELVTLGRRAFLDEYRIQAEEFHALGVREFWLFDRYRRTLTVYCRPPIEPAPLVVPEDETYATPLLRGFILAVRDLLTVADQHAEEEDLI